MLGLHRLEQAGQQTSIDVPAALRRLLGEPGCIPTLGDLGLMLWACANIMPKEAARVCQVFAIEGALDRFPDATARKTRELAWFLTGLVNCAELFPVGALAQLGRRTFALLAANYVRATGLFCHSGAASTAGRCRQRMANFDDQAYPIYALSHFSRSFGMPEALEIALGCAESLCRLQGPLGQWWWHYDALTGNVLSRYPVYSVHQDGMAPMALLALARASGRDFSGPLFRGLAWLQGANELGCSLADAQSGCVWRSIERHSRYMQRVEEALALAVHYQMPGNPGSLVVREECRPYHLGWLLYAFSPRNDSI